MDRKLELLARQLGEQLQAKGLSLVTAESCTGGWIAKCVTDIAGSSGWLDRGFVTYSNDAKEDMLSVDPATIKAHGAVSEQTALEMAQGALSNSPAEVAVAVSGIAGPGGGTPDKPVGTVCFAWAVQGGEEVVHTACFDGDREAVRRQTVELALAELIRLLDSDD